MSISRINNQPYINSYNQNKVTQIDKITSSKISDSIEISSLGKRLKNYSLNNELDNSIKVAKLRNQVENGTYNVDAKLTARSLLDSMKGK